jgi:MFS family permease
MIDSAASAPADVEVSPLSPFRHRVFAVIWTATLISNIGIWMQNATAGWLMTALAPDARVVALVQVAGALPMFLLGLPAGVFADLLDRRRLLLTMEMVITALTVTFSFLVGANLVTPMVLVGFIFLSGAAAASITPSWQAIVPQIVERKQDLAPAVGLISVSVNISRAVGPALAGVIIGSWSMAAPFSVNAACNLACVAALWWWRPAPTTAKDLPAESFGNAILVGLRHARYNQPLRATLVRASGFFVFASAYWALLPLLAREQVAGGVGTYGLMLGSIGVGAIVGAFLLPRFKARLGPNWVVVAGSAGTALALAVFAIATRPAIALGAGFVAGLSWIAVLATLNVSAQTSLPGWVRGRGLAVYTTVSFGAMTLGSLLWGEFGAEFGLPAAHGLAAAGLMIATLVLRRWELRRGGGPDLTPSMYWPLPVLPEHRDHERGPVLVVVDYHIAARDREQFLHAVQRLGAARKRNGTYRWGVFEDVAEPGHWIETFLVDSWLEYLRELKRVTHADLELLQDVKRFHHGDEPRVSRFAARGSIHGEPQHRDSTGPAR